MVDWTRRIRERLISSLTILAIFWWNKFTIFFPCGIIPSLYSFTFTSSGAHLFCVFVSYTVNIVTICSTSNDVAFDSFQFYFIHENMQTSTRQYIFESIPFAVSSERISFILWSSWVDEVCRSHIYNIRYVFESFFSPFVVCQHCHFNRKASLIFPVNHEVMFCHLR